MASLTLLSWPPASEPVRRPQADRPVGRTARSSSIIRVRRPEGGFDKVVFVIRGRSRTRSARGSAGPSKAGSRPPTSSRSSTACRPGSPSPPETKPWGTGHASLCAKDSVHTPFAAINADDFYGRTAFAALAGPPAEGPEFRGALRLRHGRLRPREHAFRARARGRGVCATGGDRCLVDIRERERIRRFSDGVKYAGTGGAWIGLPAETVVSMNMWGFTPGLFGELEARFPAFLRANAANILKAEFLIPEVVGSLVREGKPGSASCRRPRNGSA